MLGRKLTKQLVKIFGTDNLAEIEQIAGSKDETVRSSFTSQLSEFISLVNRSYEQDFKKLEISAHSLSLSSEELRMQNSKLNSAKRQIDHMLDSMDEGLFLMDSSGLVTPVVSKPAFDIIGESPIGKYVWDLIGASPEDVQSLREWYLYLFEVNDPVSALELAPDSLVRGSSSGGASKEVRLSFKPVFSEQRKLEGILMIAVDITELVQSQREYQRLANLAEMIVKRFQNPSEFSRALKHFDQTVSLLEVSSANSLKASSVDFDVNEILRGLHTCKSVMALFSLSSLAEAIHKAESMLLNAASKESSSLLVLNHLQQARLNFFSEHQQSLKLNDLSESNVVVDSDSLRQFSKSLNRLEASVCPQASEQVLEEIRSLKESFHRDFVCVSLVSLLEPLHYFVQQRSVAAQKSVDLRFDIKSFENESNDIRRASELLAPLVHSFNHVISNAIDHGIETSAERVAQGKSARASLEISAIDEGSSLVFSIKDDGRGIDFETLRKKARESGLPVGDLTNHDLIFSAGLSSRLEADLYSGRGVGMSAVRETVHSLGGVIEVKSSLGKGTEVKMIIPSRQFEQRDLAA